MKFFLLFSCLLAALHAQVTVDLLSLFSLTREEQGERSTDSDVFAFVHALALANRLTQITSDQLGEEVEILEGLTATFECDVNYVLQVQDTRSDFSRVLQDLSNTDLESFDMIIGPSRSATCVPVSFVTSTLSLPVFSPSCTSPELDDTQAHRFFARTIPSDDATALSMIELLLELPKGIRQPELEEFSSSSSAVYNKVAVLYQEDTYGSNFKDALFEIALENDDFDIEFTFIPFTPGDEDSIRSAVDSLAETKLNVILGLVFADDIRIVVDQALDEKNDIFSEKQVWIFSDGILSSEEFKFGLGIGTEDEVSEEVLAAISNSFLVQASGKVENDEIIESFQKQAFKAEFGYDLAAIATALNSQEDEDSGIFADVIARMQEHANDGERIEVSEFSLFAFDIILGIQNFLETNGCVNIDGAEFIDSLLDLTYEGVTGTVSFDESHSRDSNNAAFRLLNVRFDVNNNPVDVEVGTFTSGSWKIEDNIQFNNGGEKAPLMVDPPANVELNLIPSSIKTIIYVFGTIVLGIAVVLGVLTFKMSEKQVIRAAQPFFLFLMLIGVIISTSSIYIFPQEQDTGKPSEFKCNVPYFFISLGLTISYGALVFKLQRVVQVANDSADLIGKPKDHTWKSFMYLLLLIAVELAIFSATINVAPLELERRVVEVDGFDQPTEVFDLCSPKDNQNGEMYALYFIFHILFYTYGFRLIWKVKDLSTDFQEGKWITLSVVSQFQLYLLGIPIVVAVGIENPGVRFLVIGLLVLFSNIILMGLIFGPKFFRVMTGDDKVTWQASRNVKLKTEGSELIKTGAREDGVADSYRRSLMNTMNTDEFGGL